MGNLANALHGQGKHVEAEQMLCDVVDVQRRVLGPEHPSTLHTLSILGRSLGGQGKHAEAEAMQRELLGVQCRVLGPEHPRTLTTKSYLAVSLRGQGKHADGGANVPRCARRAATGAWTGASGHAGYCDESCFFRFLLAWDSTTVRSWAI
jgi:hypothetical protein